MSPSSALHSDCGTPCFVGGGNLQRRWLLSGERLAASNGHQRSFISLRLDTFPSL